MKEMEKSERKLISVYGYLYVYLFIYLFSIWLKKNALSRLVKECKCYNKKKITKPTFFLFPVAIEGTYCFCPVCLLVCLLVGQL